jgi:hypothetical protein
MAVKKATTTKTGSKSKPATKPKAAPKKAAPKKSTKPADAKAQPVAVAKRVAKKAPAVKLSDAQSRVLAAVHQTKETGYLGNKAQAKTLDVLHQKKLIKRGKKEGGFFRYMVTKAGGKHVLAPSAPAPAPVSAPIAPAPSPEVSASPAPSAPV